MRSVQNQQSYKRAKRAGITGVRGCESSDLPKRGADAGLQVIAKRRKHYLQVVTSFEIRLIVRANIAFSRVFKVIAEANFRRIIRAEDEIVY